MPEQLLTGQRLLASGVITSGQLQEALAYQNEHPEEKLQNIIARLGFATTTEMTRAISEQIGVPFIDVEDIDPDPLLEKELPFNLAEKYLVLPLSLEGTTLSVVMANPRDVRAIDDLRLVTGHSLRTYIAPEDTIRSFIARFYADPGAELGLEHYTDPGEEQESALQKLQETEEIIDDSPTVKLVNYLLQKAVADGASDIHVEPQEHDVRIRFRIDGVLHEIMRSPKSSQTGIISRLKIMSDIDISETRRPQDGHCGLTVGKHHIDFRVSTLPTVYGERVVLRLLRTDSVMMRLEDLGFSQENLALFQKAFSKPYGATLVTGPTGSGKSTSLYAAVNVLNSPEKHILTAEDPVEYRLPGINQVMINQKAGLTFARALRSFLRCSPDIILLGEIRDQETAQIATEAALTGHLVLSTLHTNDAASAITRLTEMGIEPFLASSALDCIIAQRLARRLCSECKEAYQPEREALIRAGYSPDDLPTTLWKPKGCRKCNGTGYKGRIGIHEVLMVTEGIGSIVVSGATGDEIKKKALEEGMVTLRQDGLNKAREGFTSIQEVFRVVA